MKKQKTYYLDAHCSYLSSYLRNQGVRVIETSKSKKFWGRDEREYLKKINKESAVFVTSDAEFITDITNDRTAHSGVIFIDNKMTMQRRIDYVLNSILLIQVFTENASSNLNNKIIISDDNGISVTDGHRNYFFISWGRIEE